MMNSAGGVLLDTSFFIHLLKKDAQWHDNAKLYMQFFMRNSWPMYLSTIVVAEWCVRGKIEELPIDNLQYISFNIAHGVRAGEFTKLCLDSRQKGVTNDRVIIKNDTKLFAQADQTPSITHYLSSDDSSHTDLYQRIEANSSAPNFKFIPLCLPPTQTLITARQSIFSAPLFEQGSL